MNCAKDHKDCHFTMCKQGLVCRLYLFSLPLEERLKMRLRWIPLMDNFKPEDLMTMSELREYKNLPTLAPEQFRKLRTNPVTSISEDWKQSYADNQEYYKKDKSPPQTQYARKRIRIYHLHNGMCWLCEKPVPIEEFTLDHVIPISKGGGNAIENLRPAHHDCNGIKGRHDVSTSEQFWALILHRDDKKRMVKQKRRLLSEFEKAKLHHKINEAFKETDNLDFDYNPNPK